MCHFTLYLSKLEYFILYLPLKNMILPSYSGFNFHLIYPFENSRLPYSNEVKPKTCYLGQENKSAMGSCMKTSFLSCSPY